MWYVKIWFPEWQENENLTKAFSDLPLSFIALFFCHLSPIAKSISNVIAKSISNVIDRRQ